VVVAEAITVAAGAAPRLAQEFASGELVSRPGTLVG